MANAGCSALVHSQKRGFQPEPKDAAAQQIGFVPARVVPDSGAGPGSAGPASGAIEIEFAAGARMRNTGTVDAATLKAAVAALADGWSR